MLAESPFGEADSTIRELPQTPENVQSPSGAKLQKLVASYIGRKQRKSNHEHLRTFINESGILDIKHDRNHEYFQSNDSA